MGRGRVRRWLARVAVWAAAVGACPGVAAPLLSPADPSLRLLDRAVAEGKLADPRGAELRVSRRALARWLAPLGLADPLEVSGWWAEPVVEARLALVGADERARPYSTAVRHRDVAGAVDPSCAERFGQPCGPGVGAVAVLESAAGLGTWLTADARLLLSAGTHDHGRAAVDRVYLLAESELFQAELGRDVLVLGPEPLTHLIWGENAPPVDLLRASTSGFVSFPGVRPEVFQVSASLFLARLAGPQRFPHPFVSGQQLAFQLFQRLELTATRLLQFGGEGAPPLSFAEVLAEHVSRKRTEAVRNFSNNRLGLGASLKLPGPTLPRVVYALVLEDTRDAVADMLQYDTDHLVGLEWAALGPRGQGALSVELFQTGSRSGEHGVWTTGMTSGGFDLGAALGPDVRAARAELDWEVGRTRIGGGVLLARASSDVYSDDGEDISTARRSTPEFRDRAWVRAAVTLERRLEVEGQVFAERVRNFGFEDGRGQTNVGGGIALVWRSWGAGG